MATLSRTIKPSLNCMCFPEDLQAQIRRPTAPVGSALNRVARATSTVCFSFWMRVMVDLSWLPVFVEDWGSVKPNDNVDRFDEGAFASSGRASVLSCKCGPTTDTFHPHRFLSCPDGRAEPPNTSPEIFQREHAFFLVFDHVFGYPLPEAHCLPTKFATMLSSCLASSKQNCIGLEITIPAIRLARAVANMIPGVDSSRRSTAMKV